jgi:hypothetical protein
VRTPTAAAGPTRRSVLVAAPALLAVACTADAPAPRPAPVDPDDALRAAAAERERALLREYDAVLASRPGLAPRLVPVRGHHAEHLEALLGPPPTASPEPSASPTADVPPAVPPPADDAAALARLAAAERAAGDAHAADCLAASRRLAPVLASLSASELSHPVALA